MEGWGVYTWHRDMESVGHRPEQTQHICAFISLHLEAGLHRPVSGKGLGHIFSLFIFCFSDTPSRNQQQ